MKNTVIITAEITAVIPKGVRLFSEQQYADMLKATLDADDVVVTKVQVFEGTDSAKE